MNILAKQIVKPRFELSWILLFNYKMNLLPTASSIGSSTPLGLQSLQIFQIQMLQFHTSSCCLLFAKEHHEAIVMSSFSSSFPLPHFKPSLVTQTPGNVYFLHISWAAEISITCLALRAMWHYDDSLIFYFLYFLPSAKYKPYEGRNFSALVTARFQVPSVCMCTQVLSHVRLFMTPWAVAC